MAGKCLWIALFVTLQISFVLCRSTGQPDEAGKEFTVLPTGEVPKAEALKDNAPPGTMSSDNNVDIDDDFLMRLNRPVSYAAIIAIIIGIFVILLLIVGFILICVCKKKPRRGYIVNRNINIQADIMQQKGTTVPGVHEIAPPLQQFSSPNNQNQNIYPAIHPNHNTSGQTGVVQQKETTVPTLPGTSLPMQQFPLPNPQIQNQNIYPAIYPNHNISGQTGVVQQKEITVPKVSEASLPMQQFPLPDQPIQNQNIYPAIHPNT